MNDTSDLHQKLNQVSDSYPVSNQPPKSNPNSLHNQPPHSSLPVHQTSQTAPQIYNSEKVSAVESRIQSQYSSCYIFLLAVQLTFAIYSFTMNFVISLSEWALVFSGLFAGTMIVGCSAGFMARYWYQLELQIISFYSICAGSFFMLLSTIPSIVYLKGLLDDPRNDVIIDVLGYLGYGIVIILALILLGVQLITCTALILNSHSLKKLLVQREEFVVQNPPMFHHQLVERYQHYQILAYAEIGVIMLSILLYVLVHISTNDMAVMVVMGITMIAACVLAISSRYKLSAKNQQLSLICLYVGTFYVTLTGCLALYYVFNNDSGVAAKVLTILVGPVQFVLCTKLLHTAHVIKNLMMKEGLDTRSRKNSLISENA